MLTHKQAERLIARHLQNAFLWEATDVGFVFYGEHDGTEAFGMVYESHIGGTPTVRLDLDGSGEYSTHI